MRTAYASAPRLVDNFVVIDVEADVPKPGGDALVTKAPGRAELGQAILERSRTRFEKKDHNVETSPVPLAGQFNPRNQLYPQSVRLLPSLLDSLKSVMVGQCYRRETGPYCFPDDL